MPMLLLQLLRRKVPIGTFTSGPGEIVIDQANDLYLALLSN